MNNAQLLNDHGLKATFQRTQILGVVEKYGHIDIDKIYKAVLKIHSSLSLATIYKNIVIMVDKGVLTEVPIVGKKSKYEIAKEDHIHLICTKCGKVMDRIFDEDTNLDTFNIAKESGFILDHRELNLYGVCESCKV